MTDDAFADYLSSSYERLPKGGVTEAIVLGLGTLEAHLKSLAADLLINQDQRFDIETGTISLREAKETNGRFNKQFHEFLDGNSTSAELNTFIVELPDHALRSSLLLERITEKAQSLPPPDPRHDADLLDARHAADALCDAADALTFSQHAYAAGFQKASDIAKSLTRNQASNSR